VRVDAVRVWCWLPSWKALHGLAVEAAKAPLARHPRNFAHI
jgi:hypothetical protein